MNQQAPRSDELVQIRGTEVDQVRVQGRA